MGFRNVAGAAGILTAIIGAALIFAPVSGAFPTPTTPGAQVVSYYTQNGTTVTIQATSSVVIFTLVLIFSVGLWLTLRDQERERGEAWGLVGLFGATALASAYTAAAAIQLALAHRASALSGQDALVLVANDVQTLLYDIGAVFLAVYLIALSLAGQRTRTMPIWLSGLGYVSGGLAFGGLVSAISPGTLDFTFYIASLGFLVWNLIGGIRLLRPSKATAPMSLPGMAR
jgi:uncharacterized protein DUF4386